MKWCSVINMWCCDMDEEEYDFCDCYGDCESCEDCEEVRYKNG